MAGMGTPLIVKDGWICWYFPDRCAAAYAKDLSGRITRSAQAVHLWKNIRISWVSFSLSHTTAASSANCVQRDLVRPSPQRTPCDCIWGYESVDIRLSNTRLNRSGDRGHLAGPPSEHVQVLNSGYSFLLTR